jgi:hypothetical protein
VPTRIGNIHLTPLGISIASHSGPGAPPGPGDLASLRADFPGFRIWREMLACHPRPGAVTATWSLNHQPRQAPSEPPSVRGHDIPAAINSPGQPAGARSFTRAQRQKSKVLTRRRLPGTESAGWPTRWRSLKSTATTRPMIHGTSPAR